jgi:hypothetical protein
VQETGNIISGKIYGYWLDNYLVSINGYPVAMTDYNGIFNLNCSAKPYDLIIYNYDIFFISDEGKKYNGLYINTPQIIYREDDIYRFDFSWCRLRVNFPALSERKFVCTKFISDNVFMEGGGLRSLPKGFSLSNLNIYIPPENTSISGRIYYLEIKYDTTSGKFISYDKFGIKDITIFNGQNDTITFSKAEVSYDPPEQIIQVNVSYPSYYQLRPPEIHLSCPTKYKSSDLNLFYDGMGSILVPILPQGEFKTKLFIEYEIYFPTVHNLRGQECRYANLGEPIFLDHNKTVNLISPLNGYTLASDTTTFEITDMEEPAIYEFNIYNYSNYHFISLYTKRKKLNFSDFRTTFFEVSPNTEYRWVVRKFPLFNTVDEFVSKPFMIDNRYSYIELSNGNDFKTAP